MTKATELRRVGSPRCVLLRESGRAWSFFATEGAAKVETSNPKWVQICEGGTFKGYRGGERGFDLTSTTFARMQANFRAHPSYVPGADKMTVEAVADLVKSGKLGVCAYNFDHQRGRAEAWMLDVEPRTGPGGVAQLWALTYFLEPAYSHMLASRYRWTSIEWEEDATDPRSGERVGPLLVGCAFTNDPFVQGMTPIQASRSGLAFGFDFDPYKPPATPTDVLCAMRRLFALPETADAGAVIGEVAKLRAWTTQGMAAPAGVNLTELVSQLRVLLNLPTLTETATIFAELDKLLGRLADEEPQETIPMPTETTQPTPPPVSALTRYFASRLNIPEDDAAIERRFAKLNLARIDDAFAAFATLSQMLGTEDPAEMAQKLTELKELDARMKTLLPEVQAAREAEDEAALASAQQDVAAVMHAKRLDCTADVEIANALLLQRLDRDTSPDYFTTDPKTGQPLLAKDRRAKRAEAQQKFLSRHVQALSQQAGNVTTRGNIFAGDRALFSASTARGNATAQFGRGTPPVPPGTPTLAEVNAYEGATLTERVAAFVRDKHPKLGVDERWSKVARIQETLTRAEGTPASV